MKITLEHIPGQELEVILRGDTESKEAKQVLATLNHASSFGKLMLQDEDESFLVDPADIRYFCGYGGDGLLSIVKYMLPQFLIIYVILYLIIFFSSKANEKAINESLGNH
ncbi:MAG: hypothetical protein IJ771_00635 [Clostridia bacterium]|nr:hypothetical protein [Clostridia bacterium]